MDGGLTTICNLRRAIVFHNGTLLLETLFVLVGDHGFAPKQTLSEVNFLRYYIPMLMLAPGIQETYGERISRVATQVDIVPTALSLLFGEPFAHQCWGRDLLSLPEDDQGFAIIKPSGNDHNVAYFRGDSLLIKPPQGAAIAGSYSLYPPAYRQQENNPEMQEMLLDMQAYVGTAMRALLNNTTGMPKP